MAGALIAVALLAALAVVGTQALATRRKRNARDQALAEAPGMSPAHPLRIKSFTELDHAVDMTRCPCGGLLDRLGEGGREGLRVVRCTCIVCEEDLDLFFELSELRH